MWIRNTRLWLTGVVVVALSAGVARGEDRPNILWICGEDLGAQLNQYGDSPAETPSIDKLASQSLTYKVAWSNAPVCAPARTTLTTGMYATSLGGQHMRSWVNLPPDGTMYQKHLREAGYDTSNHGKEDFNVSKPGKLWQSNHGIADAEQPFFVKLQFGRLHESGVGHANSQIEGEVGKYDLPAFQPDIPEMHRNWATYYHRIEQFDERLGEWIEALKDRGLMDNTIVVLWGDHGPGLPRGKRFTRDFGLHVPLIVYMPEKYRDTLAPDDYKPGGYSDRLVSFVDFGPTMLSLAGIEPPSIMQGRPFMGEFEVEPRDHIFGFRGRMDERIDMMRTVRDQRYQLIRNYMPHRPWGQHLLYLHRNAVMDKWQRLTEAGKIEPPASFYWQQKPPVELYDLKNDPDEVRNLAYHPDYQEVRQQLTKALHRHQEAIRDTGFLPEAQIHLRAGDGQSPYEWAQSEAYDLKRIRAMAERAASRDMEAVSTLVDGLDDDDPAVRYWAATGLLVRGQDAVWPNREALRAMLKTKPAPTARVVAAEALVRHGNKADREAGLDALLDLGNPRGEKTNQFTAIAALNAIDKLDGKAMPIYDELKQLPRTPEDGPRRASKYTGRLLEKLLSDLARFHTQ